MKKSQSKRLATAGLTVLGVLLSCLLPALGHPFTVDSYYAGSYLASTLGSVTNLPPIYGGLTFKYDDPNTIIIGGAATTAEGKLYSVGVVRGAGNHITGFSWSPFFFADGAYNDGGVVYGPDNVLFLARYPENQLGQTKPGSTITDKIIELGPLGVDPSPGGLNFVPAGFAGAGQLKLVSWSGGEWYTLTYEPDSSGTYNIISASYAVTISGGPEGIFFVPSGSPLFSGPSILVSEYSAGNIAAYQLDANSDPVVATRRNFITGLTGAEGAAIDPLTGDFLFSTFGDFGEDNQIIIVQGFKKPLNYRFFLPTLLKP